MANNNPKVPGLYVPPAIPKPFGASPKKISKQVKQFLDNGDFARKISSNAQYTLSESGKFGPFALDAQIRDMYNRTLHGLVDFVYIKPGEKRPNYKVVDKSGTVEWITSSTPPVSGNWAISPKKNGRIFILDFDVDKRLSETERHESVIESIEYFSKVLGVNLFQTLAQRSQSGGIHCFVMLPEGVSADELPYGGFADNPGLFSLTGSESFTGDIRSGKSLGYVLAAGSVLKNENGEYAVTSMASGYDSRFKEFKLARKVNLKEIPQKGIDFLKKAVEETERLKKSRKNRIAEIPESALRSLDDLFESYERSLETQLSSEELEPHRARMLMESVQSAAMETFHSARAFVYRALSCCKSEETIFEFCRLAGIAMDSYKNVNISDSDLRKDYDRFIDRFGKSETCGVYCSTTQIGAEQIQAADLRNSRRDERRRIFNDFIDNLGLPDDEITEQIKSSAMVAGFSAARISSFRSQRIRYKYMKRDARIVDLPVLISDLLNGTKPGKVQQFKSDAIDLVLHYFHPMLNSSAQGIMVSREHLSKMFKISDSRVAAALRFLRKRNIIRVESRQATGRAPIYSFTDRYNSYALSRLLRKSWGASTVRTLKGREHLTSVFNFRTGSLVRLDGHEFSSREVSTQAMRVRNILAAFGITTSDFSIAENNLKNYLRADIRDYEIAKLNAIQDNSVENGSDHSVKVKRKTDRWNSYILAIHNSTDSLSYDSVSVLNLGMLAMNRARENSENEKLSSIVRYSSGRDPPDSEGV